MMEEIATFERLKCRMAGFGNLWT